MTHTAGPWSAEFVGSGGDYSNPIDVYEINTSQRRIAECVLDGDAQLIAAAADAYAARKTREPIWQAMIEALDGVLKIGPSGRPVPSFEARIGAYRELVKI